MSDGIVGYFEFDCSGRLIDQRDLDVAESVPVRVMYGMSPRREYLQLYSVPLLDSEFCRLNREQVFSPSSSVS